MQQLYVRRKMLQHKVLTLSWNLPVSSQYYRPPCLLHLRSELNRPECLDEKWLIGDGKVRRH